MKLIIPIVAGAMLTVAVENATQGQPADSSRLDDAATGAVAGGDRGAKTDSEAGIGSASLADAGSGPLAFGVVLNDGTKQSGTANWTSSYNATYKRYEIAISGQNYYYLNFSTLATPTGDVRFCRSDSVGGKLLIYCYDQSGAVQPARFAFTTFKGP